MGVKSRLLFSLCWQVHVSNPEWLARCARDAITAPGVQTRPEVNWGNGVYVDVGCGWPGQVRSGQVQVQVGGADVVLAGYEHFTDTSRRSARVGVVVKKERHLTMYSSTLCAGAGSSRYTFLRRDSRADPISLSRTKTGKDGKVGRVQLRSRHTSCSANTNARASRVGIGTSLSLGGWRDV